MPLLQKLLTAGGRWVTRESVRVDSQEPEAVVGPSVVWITWEQQRRTTELARRLGVPLERFLFRGNGALRYPVLAGHTWEYLVRHRPRVLIVQNPSILLAVVGVLARRLLGVRLVVDRHTNFGLNQPPSLKKIVFTAISRFTLRHADLTVVTNQPLARIVRQSGGRDFVLPDAVPTMEAGGDFEFRGRRNLCFICTYSIDEPYGEFLRVVRELPSDVHVYITGDPARARWTPELEAIRDCNPNLTLTGFVDEQAYSALLHGADVIVDLTTFDHCLVCGAYEAIAAGRAVVLSDKQANRELFGDIPVYVDSDGPSMLQGLCRALDEAEARSERVREFRPVYEAAWNDSLQKLSSLIREY